MMQRLAFALLASCAVVGYALESDNRAEQARNVRSLTVSKVRIATAKLESDIYSGKVTRTFTPTQEPKAKGSPTPTATPTATPDIAPAIEKVK